MNCRTAREQLNLLIAGERLESGRLYVAITRHWLGCGECRAAGRRLASCRRAARHLPTPPPPPGLRARVLAALPAGGASSPTLARSPRGIRVGLFGAGAAVLLVALCMAAGRWGQGADQHQSVDGGGMARVNPSPQPPPRSGEGEPVSSLSRVQAGHRRIYRSAGVRSGPISPLRFGEGLGEGLTPAMAPGTADLAELNGDAGATARPWIALSRSDPGAVERQVRLAAPVGDDFVQIPFPCLASTAEWQIVQAVEDYRKEAAIVAARLAREVTLQQKATALSDLCERLRADTGIQLAAGQSVADEKVTVLCGKVPLRDVMRQLGRPFGYTWLRSGKTGEYRYELVQDLKSQLMEEELRNRDRNAALLALEREIDRYRPYLGLSPDEALARLKTAPEADRPLLRQLAYKGWGPAQMYFRLSPQQLATIRAGQWLSFTETPRPEGDLPLPGDVARGTLRGLRDWGRFIRNDEGIRPTFDLTDPRGIPLASAPEAKGMVRLRIQQRELGRFTLEGSSGVYTIGPGTYTWTSDGPLAVGQSPTVLKPENGAANARLARDPALRPRVSLQPEPSCGIDLSPSPSPKGGGVTGARYGLPQPKVPQRHDLGNREANLPLPASGRGLGGEVNPADPDPKVTSADVLEALYRATGMPIVSDYYTRLSKAEAVSMRNMPPFDALNRIADATRQRWNKEGSWLQLRSTSFYDDRQKEVPNRLLARWATSRRQHGNLTLDDIVEIAQLADAQLDAREMAEGARLCFGLAEWDLACYRDMRPHLRYLAMLTPEQRQEAMGPVGLLFTKMSLAQQQRFIALALQFDRRPLRTLDELAGATLRVDYTVPGWFQWGNPEQTHPTRWVVSLEPGAQGKRVPRPPVRERTREAALQALRRVDPQVRSAVWQALHQDDPRAAPRPDEAAEIFPTQLNLTVLYVPGATNARSFHLWFEENDYGF